MLTRSSRASRVAVNTLLAAGAFDAKASISRFTIRPSSPDPWTLFKLTFRSSASLRANGLDLTRPSFDGTDALALETSASFVATGAVGAGSAATDGVGSLEGSVSFAASGPSASGE